MLMSSSRNTEVDGTCSQIVAADNVSGITSDTDLVTIMGLLKAQLILFLAAIKRLKGKSDQKANDEARDERITAFYFLLLSFSHHPTQAIKDAAMYLLEIFENYGLEIKDESFTRESSLINSLLAEYDKPKAQEAIAKVPQCDKYVAAMRNTQTVFETSRLDFESAQAQEGTQENATVLKKEVIRIVNTILVPYLNVKVQLHEATYGAFSRTVAEIIAANNEVVKKRRKKDDPVEEN